MGIKFRVELPLPISLNQAYANRKPFGATGPKTFRGGRYPTRAHKTWKEAAGWELKSANPPNLPKGPYTFEILVPMMMRGDASNRIKLAEDLFVELGVTPDDHMAIAVKASRSNDVAPGRCVVIVESLAL